MKRFNNAELELKAKSRFKDISNDGKLNEILINYSTVMENKRLEKTWEELNPDTIPPRIARTLNDLFDSFKDRPDELRAEIEKLVKFLNEKFKYDENVYPYFYH